MLWCVQIKHGIAKVISEANVIIEVVSLYFILKRNWIIVRVTGTHLGEDVKQRAIVWVERVRGGPGGRKLPLRADFSIVDKFI